MATLLPSQRQDRVYVGPQGLLIREELPTVEESDSDSGDDEATTKAKKNKKKAAAPAAAASSSSDAIDEAAVVDLLKARAQQASHGVSTTRGPESTFAQKLISARLAAKQLEAPSLVDKIIDQDAQCEILAGLDAGSAAAAASVCKQWRDFYLSEESCGLWQRLVANSSARAVARCSTAWSNNAATGTQWMSIGKRLQADAAALRQRWQTGVMTEIVHRGVHSDYVMSMVLHNGLLISSSADRTIAISETAGAAAHTLPSGDRRSGEMGVLRSDWDEEPTGNGDGDGGGAASSSSSAASRPTRLLCGHRGQVQCVHAFEDHLASCSSDGEVRIWRLPSRGSGGSSSDSGGKEPSVGLGLGGEVLFRQRFGSQKVYAVNLEERGGLICGGEGSCLPNGGGPQSVVMYDWRDGTTKFEAPDDEPPNGMTTCLLRPPATGLLAAGNSDTHSQLRIWDLKAATLRDRFTLPAYCKGIRALVASSETTLVGGAGNGWVVLFDLRSGRFERRLAHTDCVNTLAVASDNRYLISGGDDKSLRVTDLRKMSFSPVASHRVRSVVFAACCDAEAIYVGCDAGDVRVFDYSAEANPQQQNSGSGGFDARQKEALAAALQAAQRGGGRPAHRTPGRIRPGR